MGVTGHYQGTLRSQGDAEAVLALARTEATAAGWPLDEVALDEAVLERVLDEEECDYRGPVRGVVITPHPNAEPFGLVFGEDLFMQDYCKTRLAGIATHVAVIGLLRRVTPHFERLDVIDEGEFWETSNVEKLGRLIDECDVQLSRIVEDH